MGQSTLLIAWSLMIQGRDDEVMPPYGTNTDPFDDFGKHPSEPHKLINYRMSPFQIFLYGLANIAEFLFSARENRMVCIPGSCLKKLRDRAIAELVTRRGDNYEPFLSEGDVLCAWRTRLAILHLSRDSNRTVVLNNAYSLRSILA